jgi:hypothetical protein
LEYFQHWKLKGGNIHLHAGGAFAKGLEVARDHFYSPGEYKGMQEKCVLLGQRALVEYWGDYEAPEDHPKGLATMVVALDEYFKNYPMASDHIQPIFHGDTPAVEFSFAIPLPIDHPQSGEPILYGGRFDLLGEYNDLTWVVDEKTTGQLGASWPKQWRLRSQFTGYVWAAREYGTQAAGAIVRGLAIYKKGFGHAESIQYRPQAMLDQWYEQLLRDIKRMLKCWEEGYWDYDLANSCSAYGGCPFVEICSNPRDGEKWLENDFEQVPWYPLGEIPVVTT